MKKIIVGLLAGIAVFMVSLQALADSYKTKEDFIKHEGKYCAVATDGVNTFRGEDFNFSTLVGTSQDFVPIWSCKITNSEASKQKFLETIKDTEKCSVITDGVNTFWGDDYMLSTRVGYPQNFTPKWKCVSEDEDIEDTDEKIDTDKKSKGDRWEIKESVEKIAEQKIEKFYPRLQKFSDKKMEYFLQILEKKIEEESEKIVLNNDFQEIKVEILEEFYSKLMSKFIR